MVLAGMLGVGWATSLARAAEPPPTPKLTEACRAGWLSFNIVAGRINLAGTRFGNINTTSADPGRSERLTILSKSSGPAVSYELTNPQHRLLAELSSGDQLLVEWRPQGNTSQPPIEYRQAEGKPVLLKIGADPHAQVVEAASLWHLLLLYPDLGRQYAVPLMRMFQTDLEPLLFVEELESELLRSDAPRKVPSRQRWSELVQQLGDERFARRQAADHELRQAGRLVLNYLEQLDRTQLDAEQQYRVRRIIAALSEPSGMDTPGAMADWLGGDPTVWLALLERDNESVRQLAHRRLQGLLGVSIPVDPQASSEQRRQQVAQLRTQLQTR